MARLVSSSTCSTGILCAPPTFTLWYVSNLGECGTNDELIDLLQVSGEGYKPCTTQIYPADDPYLTTDSVFAVKDDLVVNFKELKGDDKATRELTLNLCLAPKGSDTAKPYPTVQ